MQKNEYTLFGICLCYSKGSVNKDDIFAHSLLTLNSRLSGWGSPAPPVYDIYKNKISLEIIFLNTYSSPICVNNELFLYVMRNNLLTSQIKARLGIILKFSENHRLVLCFFQEF